MRVRISILLSLLLVPPSLVAQPVSMKVHSANGDFGFEIIQWELKYTKPHEHPWFQCELYNGTGVTWTELAFEILVNGNDGHEYTFEVEPPDAILPLRPESKCALLKTQPFPPSALPLKSASAELLHGVEIKVIADKLYDGSLVLEKDCIPDVISASLLTGLALRKQLTDLGDYGCLKMVTNMYVLAFTGESVSPLAGPKRRMTFSQVILGSTSLSLDPAAEDIGWIRPEQVRDGFRGKLVNHERVHSK